MGQYYRKLKRGKLWFYKFDYNGETYFSSCIYLTQRDAKQAENEKYKEVVKIASNPANQLAMSLIELMESRLDYLKVRKSKAYYTATKTYFSLLAKKVGADIAITNLKKADISTFLLQMSEYYQKQGRDNYRVNGMLRSYKALFNYAIQHLEVQMINPCVGIPLFSVTKNFKYIPTDIEISEVLSICDTQEQALIEFVRDTGARISEALRFKDTDIIGEHIILYTRKSKNSDLVPRKVPKPKILDSLIPVRSNYRVFARWNDHPGFLERKIKKLNHSRTWNWHNLRHRFASLHSKNKTPLFELMKLLGHENLETTQNYLQLLG